MRDIKSDKRPSKNQSSSDPFFKPGVQPKLAVGKPGDKYETEADAMANKVVNQKGDTGLQRKAIIGGEERVQQQSLADSVTSVQRREMEGEPIQQKAAEEESETVQKQEAAPAGKEEEQPVQKQEAAAAGKEEEQPVQKQEAAAAGKEEEQPVQKQEAAPAGKEEEQPVQKQEAAPAGKEEEQPVQKQEATPAGKEEEQPVQQKESASVAKAAPQSARPKSAARPSVESRIESSKGRGRQMQAPVRSEMESGFGASFSDVNIHTDSNAAEMNREMGALAFTHGKDIYFNSGQYDPGSAEGKTLLAHELTHTIQQEGAQQSDSTSSDAGLESDANTATRGFIGKMMGGIGNAGKAIMPKLRSGLRIAKCDPQARSRALAEWNRRRSGPRPATLPPANPGIRNAAVTLGNNNAVMDSYERYQEREIGGGDLVWGFFFSRNGRLNGAARKPAAFSNWAGFNALSILQKQTLFQLSRITGEVVHNRYSQTPGNLTKLQAALARWPAGEYAIHQSATTADTNTCNVFVGNAVFNAGITTVGTGGRLFSAAEIYAGASGAYQEIDKAFTEPGDIVAYGSHVGVVVRVDAASQSFVTREGYITPKGSERQRSFDELLGLAHREMRVMRKR